MIISFEGGDGSGKTTNAAGLCSFLARNGLPWLSFREPGGSPLSEEIRAVFLRNDMGPLTELLLVLASRSRNMEEIVSPGLAAGKIVVIDRFIDSTLVYQGIMGGLGLERVRAVMELTGTWVEPDLTLVLDVDPDVAMGRITAPDRFERQGAAYRRMLREAFLGIATQRRHRVIDANRDPSTVFEEIVAACDPILSPLKP